MGVWIETALAQHGKAQNYVTPFVGVWIETNPSPLSLPEFLVTPFVGVWIETRIASTPPHRDSVTPFVGVWIETLSNAASQIAGMSHPSWVCGLKQVLSSAESNAR